MMPEILQYLCQDVSSMTEVLHEVSAEHTRRASMKILQQSKSFAQSIEEQPLCIGRARMKAS
jgi:hypothetical protein